jgi:hypothetical protein
VSAFTDTNNRQWQLNVTGAEMLRFKRELGVNICDYAAEGLQPLMRLCEDLEKFVGCLWILVGEQADKRGVDEMELARGLAGDSLFEAHKAFIQAVIDFSSDARQREALHALFNKALECGRKMTEATTEALNSLDVTAIDTSSSFSSSVRSSAANLKREPTLN